MKIGYPCINREVGCTANATFRLKNYSEENLKEKISQNLECLKKTLEFNLKNELFFFRIGSGLVPFASHPVCQFNWQEYFEDDFKKIGNFLKKHNFRISVHPDHFTLLNSLDEEITKKSLADLEYHCDVLDLLGLNEEAKMQIHVGGVYGDKKASLERFVENYKKLPERIKKRLVIENDERRYGLEDCLYLHKKTGVPILFDYFHHQCFEGKESAGDAIEKVSKTWKKKNGILMVDYSSQKPGARKGSHAEHIDLKDFQNFLRETTEWDLMLC